MIPMSTSQSIVVQLAPGLGAVSSLALPKTGDKTAAPRLEVGSDQHDVGEARSMTQQHPWTRYVAIGDSFTEGIGDPEPQSPGGHRGWADRVAEVLSAGADDFAYANLAIRGRLLQQICDEQVDAALELNPDLISVSAGGNDIIRPGTDPDDVADRFEAMIERLRSKGATVVMFNGPDIGMTPVLRRVRGKVAIYNENLRAIAYRHDAIVADMWALARTLGSANVGAGSAALLRGRAPHDFAHGARSAQRRERSRAVQA